MSEFGELLAYLRGAEIKYQINHGPAKKDWQRIILKEGFNITALACTVVQVRGWDLLFCNTPLEYRADNPNKPIEDVSGRFMLARLPSTGEIVRRPGWHPHPDALRGDAAEIAQAARVPRVVLPAPPGWANGTSSGTAAMAKCGQCFTCRRAECRSRGSHDNPHNSALAAGARCPVCTMHTNGSFVLQEDCADWRRHTRRRLAGLMQGLACTLTQEPDQKGEACARVFHDPTYWCHACRMRVAAELLQ